MSTVCCKCNDPSPVVSGPVVSSPVPTIPAVSPADTSADGRLCSSS